MDTYIEQEQKILNVKANFFVCTPVAMHQEVIDTVKSWSWKWKEQVLIVTKDNKKHQLLPGALVSTKEMALLLKAVEEVEKIPDSPHVIPLLEQCTERLQLRVQAIGYEKACVQPNFLCLIHLLRKYHCNFDGILLCTGNYIYLCKGINIFATKCDSF